MPQEFCGRIPTAATGLLIAALAAGLSGCASTRTVMVESMVNPNATSGYAYTIDPGNATLPGQDARRAEVVARVRETLSHRGMFEAPVPAQADVVIRVDYGERDARTEVETITEPVVLSPASGGMMGGGPGITIGPGGAYPGSYPGAYPGQYPSSRSQVVMAQTTRTTRVSEKYIRISARENPNPRDLRKQRAENVWVVEAVIEDESDDVYECVPAMLDAATEFIGYSTAGREKVVVPVQG